MICDCDACLACDSGYSSLCSRRLSQVDLIWLGGEIEKKHLPEIIQRLIEGFGMSEVLDKVLNWKDKERDPDINEASPLKNKKFTYKGMWNAITLGLNDSEKVKENLGESKQSQPGDLSHSEESKKEETWHDRPSLF